jgi:hypothetical protein
LKKIVIKVKKKRRILNFFKKQSQFLRERKRGDLMDQAKDLKTLNNSMVKVSLCGNIKMKTIFCGTELWGIVNGTKV